MSTHDGLVIGRIIRATTAPEGAPMVVDNLDRGAPRLWL
jgi:hypothetical protein